MCADTVLNNVDSSGNWTNDQSKVANKESGLAVRRGVSGRQQKNKSMKKLLAPAQSSPDQQIWKNFLSVKSDTHQSAYSDECTLRFWVT